MGAAVTIEEFISRHSAYFQGIGFDVQYAAFIYYTLDLVSSHPRNVLHVRE